MQSSQFLERFRGKTHQVPKEGLNNLFGKYEDSSCPPTPISSYVLPEESKRASRNLNRRTKTNNLIRLARHECNIHVETSLANGGLGTFGGLNRTSTNTAMNSRVHNSLTSKKPRRLQSLIHQEFQTISCVRGSLNTQKTEPYEKQVQVLGVRDYNYQSRVSNYESLQRFRKAFFVDGAENAIRIN